MPDTGSPPALSGKSFLKGANLSLSFVPKILKNGLGVRCMQSFKMKWLHHKFFIIDFIQQVLKQQIRKGSIHTYVKERKVHVIYHQLIFCSIRCCDHEARRTRGISDILRAECFEQPHRFTFSWGLAHYTVSFTICLLSPFCKNS